MQENTSQQLHRPGPEHQRLEVFLGKWVAEGALGNGSIISVTEDCEWLPGGDGFFILQREEMRMGRDSFRTTRVIGYDREAHAYEVHHFDSHGYARTYRTTERDGVWTLAGERERAVFAVAADGETFTATWEQRAPDGSSWSSLCEFRATKVR